MTAGAGDGMSTTNALDLLPRPWWVDETVIRGSRRTLRASTGCSVFWADEVLDHVVEAVNAYPELEELRAQRAAVLALHVNDTSGAAAPAIPGMCEVCLHEWPCPTARALGGAS